MKLLVDMNLVQRLAEMLCEAGHEAVHWSEVGHGADSDHKLVAWALRNQAVILTHDLDFSSILAASGTNGPSVMQIRFDESNTRVLADLLIRVLRDTQQELEQGAIISLNTTSARVRLLPLVRQ